MKEIDRTEQQEYIAGVETSMSLTEASATAKDLMNAESTSSLEVETDGEFTYSEEQVDEVKPNAHPWHGWGEESFSGNEGWGGAVRTVLLSGSHAELKALDVDSTITADDINAGHDVTVGHNLYVKNDAGIKGTLVISENADDPGYLDDISNDTGLYIDETKEENHIHNLEVVNLTASKADFESGSFGDLEARDLRVTHSLQVSGSTVLSGSTEVIGNFGVDGPAFFQTTSVFRRDVYVDGNLYVEGSASYINTDELYIEDKSITVASGAASPEAADGAGFDIDGAGVEFHYDAQTDHMTLNKSLEILGTGSIIAPSGSIGDLTSNQINVTNLTASYAQFNSASGYFTGSFSGDGSGLTGVTMSVSSAPKCKHVINLVAGETYSVTHPFETQNVLVQVYKWEDPDYQPQDNEDEILDWEKRAIQVTDANIVVLKDEDETVQNQYKVEITYPTDLHGYVVIADAGLYISGSGLVDIVEATREVKWFGNDNGLGIIPESASAYSEIEKGESYVFQHSLGTKNLLVQAYRYLPKVDENTQEILGWYPVKYEPEYVAINDINEIEVMFSKAPESVDEEPLLEDYFGYIVVGKAGCILKNFSIGSASLDEAGVHYGTSGSWSAEKFTAATMSAESFDANDIVARRVTVEQYIDAPKIGNLSTGEQYYDDDYYGAYGEDGRVWGTYIEFTDRSIDSYLFNPDTKTNFTASSLRNDGDLYLAGSLVTNHSSFALSDEREKNNIQTLTGSLENLMKLRGVSFEWHDGTRSIGTIAQEVRSIYPELTKVIENMEGEERISVNYEGLTGVLIEAVKTLADKVETLTQRIEQLEKNENR